MSVELESITKRFEATVALDRASLTLRPGQIHALVGENGAGKSTMIKILTGVHTADAGRILLDGAEIRFANPKESVAAGISVVHQERNLVPRFSVAENLRLSRVPLRAGFVDYSGLYAEAAPWLERVGLAIDVRMAAEDLSVAQAQLVEIARALSFEARVLLLDEPTSAITEREAATLFKLLRSLRDDGVAILFVSHKLEEVEALCDRVTVIRDGRNAISDAPLADLTRQQLIDAMVGRAYEASGFDKRPQRPGVEPVLEVRSLATELGHQEIDFALRPGEILGLYGLVGSGRSELAKALVGLYRVTGGEIVVRGRPVRIRNPYDALYRHRMCYVSEDRKGEGLILPHSVERNVGITIWDRLRRRLGLVSMREATDRVKPPIERLDVRLRSLAQPVVSLSGGNQQKVSVGKWLASGCDILLVDEPTVGIDVRTKEQMHHLLWELASAGVAILLISSEMEEMLRLADRVLIMVEMRLNGELANTHDYDQMSRAIVERMLVATKDRAVAGSAAARDGK